MSGRKEWMLGIPGHNELVDLDGVLLLARGGQLRPTDLVKKLGEPWRAANEVTELAPHFSSNSAPTARAVIEPIPLKKEEAQRGEPIRSTTDRVPRTGGKIPDSSKTLPKMDARGESSVKTADSVKPESSRPAEDRAPIRTTTARVPTVTSPPKAEVRPSTPPPAPPKEDKKEEKKEEKKPEPSRPSPSEADKTDKISSRKQAPRRELPKPPPKPQPRMEPMVGKYYSPVDMLRSASFAFEPKKLLYSFPVAVLMMIWSAGMYRANMGIGVFEGILTILFMAFLVFGLAIILTGLAFVSRRQCEGRDYYFGEVVNYTVKSAVTALVYPVVALVPSLLSLGVLYLLGLARNRTIGMASTLKAIYVLPMIFAFITVLGALVYQIASMYVPAAGAIEGEGLGGSMRHAWDTVKRQWGRVVLHWLIVTVAFGVISAVCLGLSYFAIQLPVWLWATKDPAINEAFDQFKGLTAVYEGLAYGLGMILPVSLLSTLGTLSYLSLRHPGGAQLSPSRMDDTSGMEIGAMRGSTSHPAEATNPADTRPAPVDSTPSAPLSDISDDSDEQPLVKE